MLHRKEFTSFDTAAVVGELRKSVLKSRVSNVYQLDGKTLLLKLHKPESPGLRLVLEAGRRIHLTSYVSEKPVTPPAFCMALRKYLRNAWLVGADQHEFERVVVLSFNTHTGQVSLVLELFGDGNLILSDENNRILQAMIYKRMRDRHIVRGEIFSYAPPSGKNPSRVSRNELQDCLRNRTNTEVVREIARSLSIGGVYAEEVLLQAGIEKTRSCTSLDDNEVEAIFSSLHLLLSRLDQDGLDPCIVLDREGGFADVLPFRLRRYEVAEYTFQSYASFNEALDEFYAKTAAIEKATTGFEMDKLEREGERLERVIVEQEKALIETETKAHADKRSGDAIYTHSIELQTLLDRFLMINRGAKEWNTIVSKILAEKETGAKPSVLFDSFDSKTLVLYVNVDGTKIDLDLRKNLFENAARFYERSKRTKHKLNGVRAALEDSRNKLKEIEGKKKMVTMLQQTGPAEAIDELASHRVKSKEWFEKFRWFISSDGFLVVAGKDAVTNEILIKKHAEPDDAVFHADVDGAPFVVVKTNGKTPSQQVLQEAGEFAASFSRGWREGFGSVDVYWVKPEQLSKRGPSGEAVAHGAFAVSGQRNWTRKVPLKLALGVVEDESGKIVFVGGPVDAVKAKTTNYLALIPGEQEGKELLRIILKGLAANFPKGRQKKILNSSIEEIREFVPYKSGRLILS